MGIKKLWDVLAPFCERKPLYELQGKTVAIDLSCWICEAQNIAEYQVQSRMYLRNLYFRSCYLLLMNVSPVFVLEGKAPELKTDTIAARVANNFKGAKPKSGAVKTGQDRKRFQFVLKQCEEMLLSMGLICLQANGEAEHLCAQLNEEGLVDGCISQDSDCFAYGAQVVYKNFSISTQGTQSTKGGSVDVYDIRKSNIGRNKAIAIALFVGCDYSGGIPGIGIESVLKLFEYVSDDDILDNLRMWRVDDNYESLVGLLNDKHTCNTCGHQGNKQTHKNKGCSTCNMTSGCDSTHYQNHRSKIKNELYMKTKALGDPLFPNEFLINEFLVEKDEIKELDYTWKQPNIANFIGFTTKYLQWEEWYAFEKILPLVTRWQCNHPDLVRKNSKQFHLLTPKSITKTRCPKGVLSYEIVWMDSNSYYEGLIPEHQMSDRDKDKLWSTIEPQNLVDKAYPELVETFKQTKRKPRQQKRTRKKETDDLTEKLGNISITETAPKKTRKPREHKTKSDMDQLASRLKQKTLDELLKEFEPLPNKVSTPTKTFENLNFDISLEEAEMELSTIIDDIISKNHNLQQFVKIDNNNDEEEPESAFDPNTSSFFITNPVENEDLFEQEFNNTFKNVDSGSETDEYDFEAQKLWMEHSDVQVENLTGLRRMASIDCICDMNYELEYERFRSACKRFSAKDTI